MVFRKVFSYIYEGSMCKDFAIKRSNLTPEELKLDNSERNFQINAIMLTPLLLYTSFYQHFGKFHQIQSCAQKNLRYRRKYQSGNQLQQIDRI